MSATNLKFPLFARYKLPLLLLAALAMGFFYLFSVPPWMHYDEPGHFEYAWLIANQSGWPKEGDYNQEMRRELVNSMNAHDFGKYTGVYLSGEPVGDQPIDILYTQSGDQPLFYLLVSLPLRLVKGWDLTRQLYVARAVSLFLYLLTVAIAFEVGKLLFGKDHALAWLLPLFLVVLPGFTDLMTAVNNDVGAVFAYSLFVWASVLIIQQGLSLKRGAFLVTTVLLCYFMKSTAWLAVPLSLPVVLLGLLRGKGKTLLGVAGLALVAGIALSFSWQTQVPAYYYVIDDQATLLQAGNSSAPLGEKVLQVKQRFYQMVLPESQDRLQGQAVTLGAWIWSEEPVKIPAPRFHTSDGRVVIFTPDSIQCGTEPVFYTFQATLPEGKYRSWIEFRTNRSSTVYWDGLVLTGGTFSGSEAPTFNAANGGSGTWQGKDFTNLLRNGSGESSWPLFSGLARRIMLATNGYFSASQVLTLLDLPATSWYFQTTATYLFKTFWGDLGWGAVVLVGAHPYRILAIFSLLAVIGCVAGLIKNWRHLRWSELIFLTASGLLLLPIVFLRGAGTWFFQRYTPSARYFYPAIIPISAFLVWGWYQLLSLLPLKIEIRQKVVIWAMSLVFTLLAAWGAITVIQYY